MLQSPLVEPPGTYRELSTICWPDASARIIAGTFWARWLRSQSYKPIQDCSRTAYHRSRRVKSAVLLADDYASKVVSTVLDNFDATVRAVIIHEQHFAIESMHPSQFVY